MIFPDQSHINRIRDALWQQPLGGASVMVGSGFSRNAREAAPDTRKFPLWHDLVTVLCTRLYPPGDEKRLSHAITEASGTSGFLRLAQEYDAAFGRGALNSLIREIVPDEDYVPDVIHTRLLSLPWRDVFTTNWDTLLERTRPFVVDRAYGVVRTPEEIPAAPRPRIVKLHGSFPAHIPFVFTEDDYRQYPRRFAPFVNTVQQAMMETVFCLIGFSGDDPNFLHWSGWVRDNLGESAPKIYLAGWLDLSPHRRRMLEARNVVPIDLAGHQNASKWPDELRYRYATEWILHSLEHGQPYDITQWPLPPDLRHSEVPEPLQPVEGVVMDVPKDEPQPPGWNADPADLPKQVAAIVEAWTHNRKVYPGWLMIPPSKHGYVRRSMDNWERAILQAAPGFSPIKRLLAIQELVWRRENLLEPFSEKLETAVQAIVDDIDCQARTIDHKEERSANWIDIRDAWRNLAMALLTAARQRFDRNTFERRLVSLQPFLDDHPDVGHRISHERCLWALTDLDFTALDELLNAWRPRACDPAWMTRKAALLVEIDRSEEAVRLLNLSLSTIREVPQTGHTLAGPSREGWTLLLALPFKYGWVRLSGEVLEAPAVFIRLQQLAALQCDASAQKREFLDTLRDDPEKNDGPVFDLGFRRVKRAIDYSDAENRQWGAARQVVRLCEVAGLPPFAGHMVVASDMLALAADYLVKNDYPLVARLVLRVATSEDDSTFNRVWSRPCIAAMPTEAVSELVDIVTKAMTHVLPKATRADGNSTFGVTRLRVLIEALSRLVLRLPAERAEEIFKRGLSYYGMVGIAKDPRFAKPMNHLLARSWQSLPKCRRTDFVFDVLTAPVVGLREFASCHGVYPDPGRLLNDSEETPAPARGPETEGRWTEIVDLIVRGLQAGGEARKRAAGRLAPVALWGRLSASEMDLIAQALWSCNYTGSGTLPSGTDLFDWVFLLLPEPESGLAKQRLLEKCFGVHEFQDEKRLNKFLWQAGTALTNLRLRQQPLVLTTDECANLAAMVEQWIKLPLTEDENRVDWFGPSAEIGTPREAIFGLQFILFEIDLPQSTAEALFSKVLSLNQTNTPGFRLLAGLTKFLPERLDDIAMSVRMGLASDNKAVAEEAVIGLHFWLMAASKKEPPTLSPPGDLCREIGVIIANRRKCILDQALQAARWIFCDGTSEQRAAIAEMTLDGLRYLMEELRYDRDHSAQREVDVPLLRQGCAHLALAMSASGYAADPTVARWAQVVQDDPLPEVRHAEGPLSVLSREKKPAGDH